MNRYNDWIQTVLCWDGALPVTVFALPRLVQHLLPGRQGVMEITALVVPICAFSIRGIHGLTRYRSGLFRHWQAGLFIVAILLLALCDTVFILFTTVPNIAQQPDWHVLWMIYLAYLALMAVAFFPARPAFLGKANSVGDTP